jgi:nitroimidazol reductase NimA-like FMN-containing flavoprotein (pyridoxamine 5'-phosphate oxidase superfamily)
MLYDELKGRIMTFLSEQNMCVLATCGNGIPRATPIEYHSKNLTIYFIGEHGVKLTNINRNPNVSIGVFRPYTGWASTRGAQITGKAKILSRENSIEFKEALEACGWEKTAKEMGLKEFPIRVELVRIDPTKIEYMDMSLRSEGYSPMQTLEIS